MGVREVRGGERSDRGFGRGGVEIATDDHHRIVTGHRVDELRELAALARVDGLVDVAGRRAGLAVARTVVAAAREMARDEVDDADVRRDTYPQRGAERAGEMGATRSEHGQGREDDFAIETGIVVPHDRVLAAARGRNVLPQER